MPVSVHASCLFDSIQHAYLFRIWRFSPSHLKKFNSLGIAWANCLAKAHSNKLIFFNLLHRSRQFRARLEYPVPRWTALYRSTSSSSPTWRARAAPGLCQRLRFNSHPQAFISGAACGPPFADSAANPGEKSDAPSALAMVNLLARGVPLRQQVIDFRKIRPSQKVFPRKVPTSPTTGAGFTGCPNCVWKRWPLGKKAQPCYLPSADRLSSHGSSAGSRNLGY